MFTEDIVNNIYTYEWCSALFKGKRNEHGKVGRNEKLK